MLDTIKEDVEYNEAAERKTNDLNSKKMLFLEFFVLFACLFGLEYMISTSGFVHVHKNKNYLRGSFVEGNSKRQRRLSGTSQLEQMVTNSPGGVHINMIPKATNGRSVDYMCSYGQSDEDCGKDTIPFFFHIPKSGGSTMVALFELAYKLPRRNLGNVQSIASYVSEIKDGKPADPAVVTPLVHDASSIFDAINKKARVAVFLRNPVDRAESLFYYLQRANWETSYSPEWAKLSFLEWTKTKIPYYEKNFLTRILSDNMDRELSETDYQNAERILSKMLIGRTDDVNTSLERFESFWNIKLDDSQKQEKMNVLNHPTNANKHPSIEPEVRIQVESILNYDMRLYRFGLELFEKQSKRFLS